MQKLLYPVRQIPKQKKLPQPKKEGEKNKKYMPRSVAINKLASKFDISNQPNPSDEFKVKIKIIPNTKITHMEPETKF